jgi:hypothetical protein
MPKQVLTQAPAFAGADGVAPPSCCFRQAGWYLPVSTVLIITEDIPRLANVLSSASWR